MTVNGTTFTLPYAVPRSVKVIGAALAHALIAQTAIDAIANRFT